MHKVLRFIIALGLAVAVPRAAGATDGVLDTTFAGGSGISRVPYSVNMTRYTTSANALAIQNDGKIVASWVFAPCCGFDGFYRSLADGSGPDPGFGSNGFAFLTGSNSSQTRAKLDANQQIAVSGNCDVNGASRGCRAT